MENLYRCCIRLSFLDITLEKDSVESHVQDKAAPQPNALFTGLRVLLAIRGQWCVPLTCEITIEVTYEDFNTNPTSITSYVPWGMRPSNFRDDAGIAGWQSQPEEKHSVDVCVPTRTKNTWWIRTIRSRRFCHSSSWLIKEKCWVCVLQASLCAKCWGVC